MPFFTHVETADEAQALIADLAGTGLCRLDALGRHLGPVRVSLDPEHKEIWWVAPGREAWAVESTTPGQFLELISGRADPAWADEPLARADYQRILDTLISSAGSTRHAGRLGARQNG
ncbi:hypothetical protein ACIRUY_05660 [Streptomyces erythrochromogenes]|uniref:hypothetical protein n=1 Tax=Streptomyces erythrochromogenes TaxID=285574 RepID=UPI0037F8F638